MVSMMKITAENHSQAWAAWAAQALKPSSV
jgi:hypothetical protein